MLRMEMSNDMRCVEDAASFVSSLATKYGVEAKKASTVRFMVETALEVRAKELAEQNAAVTIELDERASEFVIRIMDKGLPYVISPYQKEVFRKSNLGRMLFEQLGAEGQRLTFFVKQEHDYVMPEPPAPLEETLEDREVTCRRTQPTPETPSRLFAASLRSTATSISTKSSITRSSSSICSTAARMSLSSRKTPITRCSVTWPFRNMTGSRDSTRPAIWWSSR